MTAVDVSVATTRQPGIFRRLIGFMIQYRAFRANHFHLSRLSESALRDIGIEPHQVGEIAWQAGERERDAWLRG